MAAQHMPPHWLDDVIKDAVDSGDPEAIAQAVADSDRFQRAIKSGLEASNARPDVIGPGRAQYVRQAIIAAVESAT
jgi:hypothetical protein